MLFIVDGRFVGEALVDQRVVGRRGAFGREPAAGTKAPRHDQAASGSAGSAIGVGGIGAGSTGRGTNDRTDPPRTASAAASN